MCLPREGGWPEKISFWSMGYIYFKPNRLSWILPTFSQESLAVKPGGTVRWKRQINLELMPMLPSSPTAVQYLAYPLSQQMWLEMKERERPINLVILVPATSSIPWKRVVEIMVKRCAEVRLGKSMTFIHSSCFCLLFLKWKLTY